MPDAGAGFGASASLRPWRDRRAQPPDGIGRGAVSVWNLRSNAPRTALLHVLIALALASGPALVAPWSVTPSPTPPAALTPSPTASSVVTPSPTPSSVVTPSFLRLRNCDPVGLCVCVALSHSQRDAIPSRHGGDPSSDHADLGLARRARRRDPGALPERSGARRVDQAHAGRAAIGSDLAPELPPR